MFANTSQKTSPSLNVNLSENNLAGEKNWKSPRSADVNDSSVSNTNKTVANIKANSPTLVAAMQPKRHYQSCPDLADVKQKLTSAEDIKSSSTEYDSQTSGGEKKNNEEEPTLKQPPQRRQAFKLDHLLDINPKRLYTNCKFRCRIHDVIDEDGQFWLEVLYARDDERKFFEIFKLFRLCSKISEPPAKVYLNQRLSAMYKGDWHRAVVIEHAVTEVQKVF